MLVLGDYDASYRQCGGYGAHDDEGKNKKQRCHHFKFACKFVCRMHSNVRHLVTRCVGGSVSGLFWWSVA